MKGEKIRTHALLSPSSARKWINCPPSARLEEQFPERTSPYADEGTLAHEICELKLRKLFTETGMSDATYKRRLNKLKKRELYQKEMDGYTDIYVEYISGISYAAQHAPSVAVEKQVGYGSYAQEGSGWADCILIAGNTLHVVDFKYGKGVPVSADHNPQMMLYALGAVTAYGFIYQFDEVVMHICQPRISGRPSSFSMAVPDLLEWAETVVKPAARLAWDGKGELKQGEWCDRCFCDASGCCRCRAEENLQMFARAEQPVGTLSREEIGEVLTKGRFVAGWIKKVEAYAQESILAGYEIPGWKMVEGRSSRELSDTDAAFEALTAAGYDEDMLYLEKPIPLGEIEKLITREDRKLLEPFIRKPKGKPALVEESDPRRPYAEASAQQAFGGKNTYKEETK